MKMLPMNNYCVLSVLMTFFIIQAIPPCTNVLTTLPLDQTYYKNCAPQVSCDETAKYRTANGSCNNLLNPLWGTSKTPYLRLLQANFADDDHMVRLQSNGRELPGPRQLSVAIFSSKWYDAPDFRNFHLNQFGQWCTHDTTLLLPDFSGPDDCCAVQNGGAVPPQCQLVIKVEPTDPIFENTGKTCMAFRRATTTNTELNCTIKPQNNLNSATVFIDASQVYGHTDEKASELRSKTGGRLKTEMINGQEFNVQQKRNSSMCQFRDNVNVCFDHGDVRNNQHFGITMYSILFTRFHNHLVSELVKYNPTWTDETLYQEARKINGAVNQILVYRDYLPLLLGEAYSAEVGLTVFREINTVYDPEIMPQVAHEFSAGCFRVPHNVVPSKYYFLNMNNQIQNEVNLTDFMSYPDPLIEGTNFEDLLRGMSLMPGRYPISSYNFLISNFMFHRFPPPSGGNADHDLLAVDIQRGRDVGLSTYTVVRELCGFPKVSTFDDLLDVLSTDDVAMLRNLYADVTDVDLLVGALLEPLAPDASVGPTARCIIADAFYRIRHGDRFFFDVSGQPGSFTPAQLDVLWSLDLRKIFCGVSAVDKLPENMFMADGYSNDLICEPLNLNLQAWTSV